MLWGLSKCLTINVTEKHLMYLLDTKVVFEMRPIMILKPFPVSLNPVGLRVLVTC